MLVKITANNVNYFVNEDESERLRTLKEDFRGVVETTPTGEVKKYTEEDYRKFVKVVDSKESVDSIFNIQPVILTDEKKGK